MQDFLNVEYIKDEVALTDYKNRLFGCYLKSGSRLYATHLVFAVGQKYAPLTINNKKVGVSQISTVNTDEFETKSSEYIELIEKIGKLKLNVDSLLFLIKFQAINNIEIDKSIVKCIVEDDYNAYRLLEILERIIIM